MPAAIPITDLPGLRLGNAQDLRAATGCTVLICEEGAVAGVDVRGGAPGTRETDLLRPENLVERIHAVLLAGGSAFGLDAAGGVMAYLEERGIGFDVGAGTGATVGKALGMDHAMKGGLGTFALQAGDLKVGAVVAVNAFGDVVDPATGRIVAGAFRRDPFAFLDCEVAMLSRDAATNRFSGNTTIGAVVTNAGLTKAQAAKVASMAQDGLARTLRPAHTMVDGDTIFALSVGGVAADLSVVGLLAARVVERAVLRAVDRAASLGGFTCLREAGGA